MKFLSFSYCFPNAARPSWGVFVAQRLAALAELVELQVVSPVPICPPLTTFRPSPGPVRDAWGELNVHRPRFWYVPKLLKSRDAHRYARGLRRWLRGLAAAWRPDLLDAHFIWPDGVAGSLLARELGIPYAITLRGKIYPCLEVPAQRQQCAEALRNAAAVISVSGPMARVARELGAQPERVHVIPNGVDTELFQPQDKATARAELDLPAAARILVTVAHLGPRKGHFEVLEAMSTLDPDVHLVLVGGVPDGQRCGAAIRARARELGLTGRVILVGRQPHHRVPLYLAAADATVLASYREGCPNVVLESLAAGRPVVASDVGAVPDLLRDGADGYVVPPREVKPLASALAKVLSRDWDATELQQAPGVRSWTDVAAQVHTVLAPPAKGKAPAPQCR